MVNELNWTPSPSLGEKEEEEGGDSLEQVESHKSVGALLALLGYAAVVFAAPKIGVNLLKSDGIFFESLAKAPENTLPVFGDSSAETIYVGDKEKLEGLYTTVGLGPVELILDEGKRFRLLSVTARSGSFAFNMCLPEAPERTQLMTVEELNELYPRAAF